MDLNAYVFSEDLAHLWHQTHLITDPAINQITHFDVLAESENVDRDALTIARAEQFNSLKATTNCTFIILDCPDALESTLPEWMSENDYMIARSDIGFANLLEQISHVFAKYNTWQETLHSILANEGSVDDLVVASLNVCECDITVIDVNYRIISYRQYSDSDPKDIFAGLEKGSRFTKEQLMLMHNSFTANPGMRHPFKVKGLHSNKWIDGPHDISLNIDLPEHYIVRINMAMGDHTTDISPKHYALMNELGRFVRYAYLLFPHQMADIRLTEPFDAVKRMLEGEHVSRKELTESANAASWNSHDDLYVMAMATLLDNESSSNAARRFSIRAVANRLQEMVDYAIPLFPNDDFCIIVNYTKARFGTFEKCTAFLERFASDNNAIVVTSHTNQGLRHCKHSYDQVRLLSTFAVERNLEQGVYPLDEMALDYTYEKLSETIQPFACVPFCLIALLHADNANGTDLYRTLRAYIENDCSPVKTAKALYMDRSTFYRRLEQIVKIMNEDLSNPRIKYRLMLAFQIIDREDESAIKNI